MARRDQTWIAGSGLSPLPSGPCSLSSSKRKRKDITPEQRIKKNARSKELRRIKKEAQPPKSQREYRDGVLVCLRCGSAERRKPHGRQKNGDCIKCSLVSLRKGWVKKRDKENAKKREKYHADPKAHRERQAIWDAANRYKIKAADARRSARDRDILSDGYVKMLLAQRTDLKFSEIPEDLMKLKREHLKMHRKLKTENQ